MNKINKEITSKKYLFAIDLDGTLLNNSQKATVSKEDKNSIQKLIEMGHKVCIMTGRSWDSSKKVYEELGLDTIIANYNGGQIHNPNDYSFLHNISEMNLNDALYILGDKKLKSISENIVITGPGWVRAEKSNESLENVFGFKHVDNYKVGLDYNKLPLKPAAVIIDTNTNNILETLEYLQRRYGDLAEFSSWSKGQEETPVIDMTSIGTTKAKSLALASRFYGIKLENTIAIGDGYNDLPMFNVAEISVAMCNASEDIKEKATYITKKTNKESGVSEFINNFLNKENFVEELKNKRKHIYNRKDQTTSSH